MSSHSDNVFKITKRIDLLFSKFAAFYGNVWRCQFKDERFLKFAKKEWQTALARFSDQTLTTAILSCRDFYELPPTLPQMIDCCRRITNRIAVYVVKEEVVPTNKEIAKTYLRQCKEFLTK